MKNYFFISLLILLACNVDKNGNRKNEDLTSEKVKKDTVFTNLVPTQKFEFKSNKKYKILGKEGTILEFSKNCFKDYNGIVHVELIEAYNYYEMIINNLSTIDVEGNLLETKGMIYISATDTNKNELYLSKPIQITFKNGNDIDYNLYEGLKSKNSVIWKKNDSRKLIKDTNKYYAKSLIGHAENPDENISIPIYDSIEVSSEREKLFLETLNLGWLNLDKSFSLKGSDITINICNDCMNEYSFYLIAEHNSILVPGEINKKGKIEFKKIPKNIEFKFVALKINKEGANYYTASIDECLVKGIEDVKIDTISLDKLKQILKSILN